MGCSLAHGFYPLHCNGDGVSSGIHGAPRPRKLAVIVLAAPIAGECRSRRAARGLVCWRGSDGLAKSLHPISGLFTFALALPNII